MGSELDNMAFRSMLVAIAIIIAGVHAAPMPNDIVPETKFVGGAATSAHAAAKQIVTEMIQAGRDWTACEDLANTTREEVTDAVKTHQKMLDSADKGCNCAGLGQDEVNRTLNERNAAATAVTDAKKDLESATSAQVQLSSQEFQFLQAGECGWIMTDAAYLSAYAIYTKAVNMLTMATKTYSLSIDAHREAVTEAARLKLECECATQSAHATAWAEANEDNDANAAAWAQAHHIDCVVQSISEANCVFGPVPGLTKPTLCDDIESVSCAAESGSAQHVLADEEPVYIERCPLDMPNCGEQEAIATAIEGLTGSSGEQCFSYSCPPPIFNPPKPVNPCELGIPNCGEQEAIATAIEGRTGSSGEQCFSYSCPPPALPDALPDAPTKADTSKECAIDHEGDLSCAAYNSVSLECYINSAGIHPDQPDKARGDMVCECSDAVSGLPKPVLKPECNKSGCTSDCKVI